MPLIPSPLAGPDDPTTLPPGPFSAARILSFAPRKGASWVVLDRSVDPW